MIHDLTPKDLFVGDQNNRLAEAALRQYEHYTEMPIDVYLETVTSLSQDALALNSDPKRADRLAKTVEFYRFFQLQHNSVTVGDALNVLRDGKVPKETVELFIHDELAVDEGPFQAIGIGYPELRNELKRVRDRAFQKLL